MLEVIDLNDRIIIKDNNVKNINILITKKNFSDNINDVFFIKQIHSDKIIFLDNRKMLKEKFTGDSIVTTINSRIGIKTADCLPIFIYSGCGKIASVIHAGWRGTADRILEKTIKFIENTLHIRKELLNFILGVSICKNCYEIKNDMYESFIKKFGSNGKKFFSKKIDRFDLKGANIYQLEQNGIKNEKIFNLNKCSYCNNDFFSYRKGDTKNRTLNIIQLDRVT